jgi:hypothetical protein
MLMAQPKANHPAMALQQRSQKQPMHLFCVPNVGQRHAKRNDLHP